MAQVITPPDVAAPFSRYAHGILTEPGCRWLHVSGQVGIRPDGTMAMSGEAQLEQAFSNVFAVLRAAGMDKQHLVKLTVLLTRADEVGSLSHRARPPARRRTSSPRRCWSWPASPAPTSWSRSRPSPRPPA